MSEQYFHNLNYTLSNEDTRVEHSLLKPNASSVFTIGGSGSRVLPLIARNPKQMHVVDLSTEQLALIELRHAAARCLSRDEFLFFMGYRGGLPNDSSLDDSRFDLFHKLDLSPETAAFWREREHIWKPRGFIFLGRWENHFQKLGRVFRDVLRIDSRPIFEAHSLEEQRRLFEKHFKPLVFRAFVKIAASEFVFNKFLYKGHFSGSASVKTESRPPSVFIEEEFTRLFTETLIRKNYFLQVLFLGGILYEEGLPLEARTDILEAIKVSETKVNYMKADLTTVISQNTYDFLSLSDTISYLPTDIAGNLLKTLPFDTRPGSRVVIRSFLRRPPELTAAGWIRLPEEEKRAVQLDTTGVYEFDIFERI
ncbi:MAG: DUF3419 family protein [Bdellovibrionales bacterium]|nr:DUF3419 family protein [Bdellovibrionales bacterium]